MPNQLPRRVFDRIRLPVYPYKMYMHRYKCIFIHIPKTAGTSILNTLGYHGGRHHVEWAHFRNANVGWFNRYHKFSVSRHPIERAHSAFRYAAKGGNGSDYDKWLAKQLITLDGGFDEFVLTLLNERFIHENVLFRPQYQYICNHRGELTINTLLRFESLNQDWKGFAKQHDMPFPLATQNVTAQPKDKGTTLSREAVEKVHALYEKDFSLLNYGG